MKAGLAAGGVLFVTFSFGNSSVSAAATAFQPNAFIRIDADGLVTVLLPKSEMGQGISTSIPMLIAEELDVELERVRVVFAAPGETGGISQVTGGSTSTRSTTLPMREAGAKARAMLVSAAAQRWGVPPESCGVRAGEVLHESTGRRLAYGELVAAAALAPVPDKAVCKDPAAYRIVGKPQRRLDSRAKVTGTAPFAIDRVLPGMKVAAVLSCPVVGGRLKGVDSAPALRIAGVTKVVPLEAGVAVIADHTGAARAGLAALHAEWVVGPNAGLDQSEIVAALEAALQGPDLPNKSVGDAAGAMAKAAVTVDATYHMPFLAHAPMEPINCTASVTPDLCEVWVGHQSPVAARAAAARASGLPPEQVQIHNHIMGGGFGRKVEVDMVVEAVRIAKTVDHPVKLIWSREEDIRRDFFRPYYVDHLSAGLGADGKPVGWRHRIAASSLMGRVAPDLLKANKGLDRDALEGSETPYRLANATVEYARQDSEVQTGFWRGVGATHNIFVVECFIDECAQAAGADPVAYRDSLLDSPRARAVLALAAEKAGWGSPLPPAGAEAFRSSTPGTPSWRKWWRWRSRSRARSRFTGWSAPPIAGPP